GDAIGEIEASAQDATVRHPEIILEIEAERGRVGTCANAVADSRETVIAPGGECLLQDDGDVRRMSTITEVREAVRSLQRQVADPDARAVGGPRGLVEEEARNEAGRDVVGETVQHVGE